VRGATVRRAPRRCAIPVLALVLTMSTVATVWLGDRHVGSRVVSTAREPGPAGVAAAYGYPLRCLRVTIVAADDNYARADFNHLSPCGRYTWYPTAIFHYDSGAWRPVLDAAAYSCPVHSLPAAVQTELEVCQ
jgi:hypothetical protein